jgi:hypothetical protein
MIVLIEEGVHPGGLKWVITPTADFREPVQGAYRWTHYADGSASATRRTVGFADTYAAARADVNRLCAA